MKTAALLILGLMPLLVSCEPAPEMDEHTALNAELAQGWNTWDTNSVLSHVLLPEGLAVSLQLQDAQSSDVLEYALIGGSAHGSDERVVAGPHAEDGSYTELTIEWRDIHVRVQSSSDDDDLYLMVTPIDAAPNDSLFVKPEMLWDKDGEISINDGAIIGATPGNSIELAVHADMIASTSEHIEVALAEAIAISTDSAKSSDEIANVISKTRANFLAEKSAYEKAPDLFDAVQSVLAWNVIYEPTNDRVITPVSRNWNVGWGGWILFEWDTYFVAYMHSLNNKELAYANAIAMTKEITDRGLVPNFASSRNTSEDRSEPPVGSLVVKEIYRKYREEWFVAEVFDELLTWNRWWSENRDIDGYLVWGSDPYPREELPEWLETAIGRKQGSMWESGLDNSPMFDDAVNDDERHRLMQADVGLMSLYVADCQSLAELAGALGKSEIQAELTARAQRYAEKLESLWDDDFGMYLNKDLITGEFSYRLSPTLFYPLIAGVPDQQQAQRMIDEHFYNPDEFWGEYMIPSIARNDEAFADNTYWRGRIWAPMNFLVYLGLRNYDLPSARNDFVEKSSNLLLQSWLGERHVYENYNSETGQGDDAGMSSKFYHWGALLGFIGLMEDGYVPSPQDPLNKVD